MPTKRQLVGEIAEHSQLSRAQVAAVLDSAASLIARHALAGRDVQWTGFGTFKRAERCARTGRNPHTGDPVDIPSSVSLKFKPSKGLAERTTDQATPDSA